MQKEDCKNGAHNKTCTHSNNTQKKNFFPVGNFTYCSFICNLELNDPQKNIMKSTLKNFSEISRKSTLYKYRSLFD